MGPSRRALCRRTFIVYRPSSRVLSIIRFCHSIRKGPSPTHGLPGMMIVGSITGAESGNHWFRGYQGRLATGIW